VVNAFHCGFAAPGFLQVTEEPMLYPLPPQPDLPTSVAGQIAEDYERLKESWPSSLEDYILGRYRIDLTSEYGGIEIKNPFGKASGQLSLATHQVQKDAESGLGFVVLKTVIAQNESGSQSMQDWAIKETHMTVERIAGSNGQEGWTVTWKGRGWHESFASYLGFFAEALSAARDANTLVAPSCKYHLPMPGEKVWRTDEYAFTTAALLELWKRHGPAQRPMPLEKDFSPTLAGPQRASQMETIVEWLRRVPALIRQAVEPGAVRVGLKIFNAMFDDEFQLEMLKVTHKLCDKPPDFLVYANRLFDPQRVYEGKQGVAYGGPDLSARNLRMLQAWRALACREGLPGPALPISGTGDICSGKMAVEYLLRGCSSFQMHTFFQLPDSEYGMKSGHKTQRGLHELLFHPTTGFVAWIVHMRQKLDWPESMNIKQMAEYCAAPENKVWTNKGIQEFKNSRIQE